MHMHDDKRRDPDASWVNTLLLTPLIWGRTVCSLQQSKLLKDGILKLWYIGAVQQAFEFIKLS